jgi:hypothetical protein
LQSQLARPAWGIASVSSYNNLRNLAALSGLQPIAPFAPKRDVFISSFHDGNGQEVDDFIYRWAHVEGVFTPKALELSTTTISSTATTLNT